jgi:hypothetical protein
MLAKGDLKFRLNGKRLKGFLLFLATMASSHAEDRRLAKDGGEVRMYSRKRGQPSRSGRAYFMSSSSVSLGVGNFTSVM